MKPRPAGPSQLHFQIGRITLHGYAPADQKRFSDSLQSSLAEFAHARREVPWTGAAKLRIAHLDAGELRAGASPEEAARHVAAQLFARLSKNHRGGKQDV